MICRAIPLTERLPSAVRGAQSPWQGKNIIFTYYILTCGKRTLDLSTANPKGESNPITLREGDMPVKVKAIDAAGNTRTPVDSTLKGDQSAPTGHPTSTPSGAPSGAGGTVTP